MNDKNDKGQFCTLVEEVDYLLAHQRHLGAQGIHLIVTHLDHMHGTLCASGEMIGGISLGWTPEPVSLGLTHMSLLLMDCLCRHRMPLSAWHVEQIMSTEPFYVHYAANRIGRKQVIARPDRRSVRVYVSRIRKQMEKVFQSIGLAIDPDRILVSELTDSNVGTYKLKATVEIVHIDG